MRGHNIPLIDEGGETDSRSIRLGTRVKANGHVKNIMKPESSPEELREELERFRREHPEVVVRSLSTTYNCVGMVFATRRSWVDTDQVRRFLEDDGYRRLPSLFDAEIGDVVLYMDDTGLIWHVGLVAIRNENLETAERSFMILSKWSSCAEFIHRPEDLPRVWGTLREVWTDRKRYDPPIPEYHE